MVKAANLAAKDPNGKSDPYCHVFLGAGGETVVHKTDIKQSTLEPEWNATFTLYEGELTPFLHSVGKGGREGGGREERRGVLGRLRRRRRRRRRRSGI